MVVRAEIVIQDVKRIDMGAFIKLRAEFVTPAHSGRSALRRCLARGDLPLFQTTTHSREHRRCVCCVRPDPPLMDAMNGERIKMIPSLPPPPLRHDQTSGLQHAKMLHHRAPIDFGQRCGKRASSHRASFKKVDNVAPRPVSKGLEESVVMVIR